MAGENNTGFPDEAWTGAPGINTTVPKFGENRFNVPAPPGSKPVNSRENYLNPSRIGKTAAETAANMNNYLYNNVDYNNYAKTTAYDAGPNGANAARYLAYGEDKFYKIGFDPSIDNESKFIGNTTWWDDTKRMLTKSFVPLYGEGLKANLTSYLDLGDGDFGQDIRAAANYEKYSNIGYSTRGGVMPFISNTAMSYAYTAGILTEAVAETYLLRKLSPGVFGGKDMLLSAPKNIMQGVKTTGEYLKDMKNINAARSAYSNALKNTANFFNPINHTWDNFVNNVARNTDNITGLARAQRTFGAFYKDVRNLNMALSEGRLEGGFVENKMMNDLYNDHYFKYGEVPDDKTMELYQRKAEAAGFSATMQNLGLVYYTNKITLPTLMKFGPFKALDNIGAELAEGTLLKEGSGFAARVAYSPKTFMNGLKNLAKPATWGRGGLNYFKSNLLEGVQENLQDVIADSTQAYFTNSIFQPERGQFEMYMAGLKDGLAKQWSHQGLETFASGFLMGFGNTIVEGSVQKILKAGNYLKDGKAYTNYLNERHAAGQNLADIVNDGLKSPEKFFGSRIFDHGNQALLKKDIDSKDTSEKEKIDSKSTSFITSVLTALDTGTFDMYIDNLQGMREMTDVEIEDSFKLKAGEGKKALERIDKIIDKAKRIQSKHEYHNSKFKLNINVNDYKEGTIEREHAELMTEAHRKSKFNAIFLDEAYEDNVERIEKIGKTFQDFVKYTKSDSKVMMSDLDALYNRPALQSQIQLLESEIASMEGITDPAIVTDRERKAKLLERLKKYDKVQSEYDAVQQAKANGSLAITQYLKEQVLKNADFTEEEKKQLEETDEKILKRIQEIEDNYKQGFKDYLVDLVGGESNYQEAMRKAETEGAIDLEDAFTRLKDLKKLDVENQSIIKYLSVLNDPGGYMEHVQRNYKWMKSLYVTRKEHIRQMIEKSLQTKEYKELLQSLSDDGIYIDLDEFAKWIKDKEYQPKEFIDATKEMVIPKGSDTYSKYYQRFVKVAKAQAERIAEDKINKEQSLKDRTEELAKMKQKELDDARTVYLKEIKAETGSTEAELIKAIDDFAEQNVGNKEKLQEQIDKIINVRTLLQSVNSPALLAAYYQVRDKLFAEEVLDQAEYNANMDAANEDIEQLKQIKKISEQKQKTIKGASPADILEFSIDFHVIGSIIDTKLETLTQELQLAETASENPNLDPKDTKAYKVYQQRIKEIEDRYQKALEESKEDIDNFDDEAPRKAQINVTTPWEQLPKELVDILQPKFEAYLAGKDVDEADLYEFRQNWLLTQNSEIQKFLTTSVGTAEKPLEVSEKIPKLKTIPADQQKQLDESAVNNLTFTVGLRKIIENKLNKKDANWTKEQKAAMKADIDALQKYINYQRSIATPVERLRSIANDFLETITKLQDEVAENVVNGRRQNYILDQGKETETIPQRVTELTEEIEMSITPEKPPYLYYGLNDVQVIGAINTLISEIQEGTIKKEGAIETFIQTLKTFKANGKLTAFTDAKFNDVRGLLYIDAVKKGVMTKEEALLGLTAAKMSNTDYAKFIKEYEAPEAEEVTPTTAPVTNIESKNTISNGDKIISVQTKPISNEIKNTNGELFLTTDNDPEGRIYINMEPLKDILVVPNNTLTITDKKTGKEIINKELNSEGAVIFEAMQGRLFVVANINGQLVPFYKSSAGTSGKTQGAWYPFFGYTGSWLVKGGIDKATGKMSYSPEIDKVTDLLNENLIFPDKYINRSTNTVKDTDGNTMFDFNEFFKVNRLWQKTNDISTGTKANYSIKGLKENTRSESGVVALITGLNTTELDSSDTPQENNEWFKLINNNIKKNLSAITTDETNLDELVSPGEITDLSTILNILGDVANQESSDVGVVVDDMIRDYLAGKEPTLPSYMTKNHPAYQALFGAKGIITEIRDKVLEGKWTILSDHVKVFDRNLGPKTEDGKPIGLAGEVDLIYIDNETGEIEIIDIKTAKPKNWLYWDTDKKVKTLEFKLAQKKKDLADKANAKRASFIEKDIAQIEGEIADAKKKWSKKLNYSIQQTIYRNLVYRMTGKMPRAIKILPLSVDYTKDGVINNITVPTSVTDKDKKGIPGKFITLEPVAEVEKYVPIGVVKDTIESPDETDFVETDVISNQINKNLGKTFAYNGRTGVLIKNLDGTYSLDTPTEIIDISINGNNKISPETTLELAGLTPIKITERPFKTLTINGVEHTVTELDTEEDIITVDGVRYKVTRTPKTKKINGVEFMSNQKQIDELDARIREVSDDIVKRETEGKIEGEDVNTFTKRLAERQVELEALNAQRADLVGTNKIRKITGTNATDILYIINQSPEIFLSDTSKSIEEENEDLEDIKSLFPSDASFQEVYEIMKTRPESLSKLINGEYTGSEQDIQEIKQWITNSIASLSVSNNDVSAAIAMLTKLMNEVELIKLTKDGKISKRQPKGLFERQNQERRQGTGLPDVQESGAGPATGVPGQPSPTKGTITPDQGKQVIDEVKGAVGVSGQSVSDILGDVGTEEGVEGYEEIKARIDKATEEELDAIENELIQQAIRDQITLDPKVISDLIQERRFQLQDNVTVQDVKQNQMVVSIAPVIGFSKDSEGIELPSNSLFKVSKLSEKSVTLQSLDNKKVKVELTASEFNKKFKPKPKATKTKTVKKPITKEYQAVSLDVAEELDKFAQNQGNIQAIQDTFGEMTEDEADVAFLDAVKQCKTKK